MLSPMHAVRNDIGEGHGEEVMRVGIQHRVTNKASVY